MNEKSSDWELPKPIAHDVHLTYFKKSGKYYTEGKYTSYKQHLFEIWEEVINLRNDGNLPDLRKGATDFNILIEVPTHPHAHPTIIMMDNFKSAIMMVHNRIKVWKQ